MSQHEDPNEFLESGGVPSAKFPAIGAVVKGVVLSSAVNQQRDFDSGEPKFYEDGNPMKQLVVTLMTEERDPEVEGDDGTRRLFVKGQMLAAVRVAIRKAGARLEPGGTIVVKYIGDGTPAKKHLNPPKQFEAAYRPGNKPVDDLLDEEPTAAAEQPAVTQPAAASTPAPSAQPSAADLLDA